MKSMNKAAEELIKETVLKCASMYNFDGELALREIRLENVERKKEKKIREVKRSIPMPFNGECNDSLCSALRQNSGLYTQCRSIRIVGKKYCNYCEVLSEKREDKVPEYGTIEQRMLVGLLDYVDPVGRKPVCYMKVMKKLRLTKEEVLEEAKKLNIIINELHFLEPTDVKRGRPSSIKSVEDKKEPKQKGRPKKDTKVLLEIQGEDDLFTSLLNDASNDSNSESSELSKCSVETNLLSEEAVKALSEEAVKAQEKAEKEAAKALEKERAKAEKEAAKALEKAEKDAAKALEKAVKEAAKAADKAAKEQAKAEAKAAKEAEAKAAKEAEKAAKETEKARKETGKDVEKGGKESDGPVAVKKITFEGKKYLKAVATGVIYDLDEYIDNQEQVEVGRWNESENKIDFDESSESDD
jgi:hypothetical protein